MIPEILPDGYQLGLSLDRYQEIMRIPEAAFNGLQKLHDPDCVDCDFVWTQRDRDAMALAIARAEEMREKELGYFTAPKYLIDEEHDYSHPLILDRRYLILIGNPATTTIQDGVALDLGTEANPNDPVEINIATTMTVEDEICIFHPGTAIKIRPSVVSIAGGAVTIKIPRSRLVKLDLKANCDPLDYYDNDNFITSVDVKRCYTDPSAGASFVWYGPCVNICTTTISDTTQSAYARVTNQRLAIIKLYPATYASGTWTIQALASCCTPSAVRVSYLSGIRGSVQMEIETAALAHTLLPDIIPDRLDLCSGCWEGDQLRDPSNMVTPYGVAVGAIKAWLSDSRSKIGMGGKFPRVRR